LQVLNNSEKLHEKDEGMLKTEELGQTDSNPNQTTTKKRKTTKKIKPVMRAAHDPAFSLSLQNPNAPTPPLLLFFFFISTSHGHGA